MVQGYVGELVLLKGRRKAGELWFYEKGLRQTLTIVELGHTSSFGRRIGEVWIGDCVLEYVVGERSWSCLGRLVRIILISAINIY